MMRNNVVLAALVALLCTSTVLAEEVNLGKNGDTSTVYTAGGVSIGKGTIGSADKRINIPIGIGYNHNIDADYSIALGTMQRSKKMQKKELLSVLVRMLVN